VCDAAAPGARVDRFLATVLGAGPLLAVPVTKAGATIGAFVLVREKGGTPFSVYDRQKAALILAQAAGTLHRYELYQELEDQLRETTLIHRFAVQAVGARTPNDIAWYLLESLRSVFTFDRGQVYLSDRESRRGLTPIAHFHTRAPASERSEPQPSHLTIPLCCGDTIVGSVELQRSNGEPFDSGDHRVATALAQQSATAIQNLWLQEASGKVSTYRELDRVKTDLLNAVSHDFRGALANIKGYASTLLDDDEADTLGEEQRTFLKTIEEEADRLRDLLEHLLDLSKIDAGVLRMDLQTVQIGRIVNEAISSASLRASHTIEQAVPEGLFVMADRRRLRQVLHNLIENAVKYSPEGGAIRVGAMATETEVTVSVSDHGLGIPRHQWDRIFRPYQRAEGPASHAVAGNGLGLAICKGIVEAHGGRIWVESEPNAGSTFSFTVSRAAAPDEESTLSSEPRMAVARK
jgi:K+-sensing histidine kinase KdpD